MIAIWKPWAPGVVERAHPLATVTELSALAPTTTPSSSPSPDPEAIACISDVGWRVVTRDVTSGRESRSWIAVVPVAAERPGDAGVPFVRVVIGRLLGLGYCAPANLPFVASGVHAWRLEPPRPDGPPSSEPPPTGAASPITPLARVSAPAPRTSDLYAPPDGADVWAPGAYVFEVISLEPSESWWFGVEVIEEKVITTLRPASSTTPPSSPTAAPAP